MQSVYHRAASAAQCSRSTVWLWSVQVGLALDRLRLDRLRRTSSELEGRRATWRRQAAAVTGPSVAQYPTSVLVDPWYHTRLQYPQIRSSMSYFSTGRSEAAYAAAV
eukprot:3268559-Rhodomonas_salina.1